MNIAQCLADLERGIVPNHEHTASVTRPYAIPLLAGNEEEEDNVFIEYVSNRVSSYKRYQKKYFEEQNNGVFLEHLFNEKIPGTQKPIPRPTKSCRPDWVLKFRGCPLAYGEGKSCPVWQDTGSGTSYTTMCAANILNFMPTNSPAIVMHSTNARFRFQAVRLDLEGKALQVLQRDGMRYDFADPQGPGGGDSEEFQELPIMYRFERVPKSVHALRPMQSYLGHAEEQVAGQAQAAQASRMKAEDIARKSKRMKKIAQSPSRSYEVEDAYEDPYNEGDGTVLILKVNDDSALKRKWMSINWKLRQYAICLLEAVDVMTALLMEQNPDDAALAYDKSLQMGKFTAPVKFENMKEVMPFDRKKDIVAEEWQYDSVDGWLLSERSGAWMSAKEKAEKDISLQSSEPATAPETSGTTPVTVSATPAGASFAHLLKAPSAHKLASEYMSQMGATTPQVRKKLFATPVKTRQQKAQETPKVTVKSATPMQL